MASVCTQDSGKVGPGSGVCRPLAVALAATALSSWSRQLAADRYHSCLLRGLGVDATLERGLCGDKLVMAALSSATSGASLAAVQASHVTRSVMITPWLHLMSKAQHWSPRSDCESLMRV